MTDQNTSNPPKNPARHIKQWAPIGLLVTAFVAFFATGFYEMLTLDELARRYADLNAFIQNNFWSAVIGAIAIYIVVTAASLPAASLLSVAIGLMFGWALGATIIVIGATLGASILFHVARSLLVDFFSERAGDKLNIMAAGFRDDAVSYMLFLRLAAIFPFFVVNFVPAILGVRFFTFFWTTAIGIIPGTIAYAFAGEGLRSIVAERADACTQNIAPCGQPLSPGDIITSEMLIAFILLALVSLLPVVLKRLRNSPSD